MGKYTKKPGQVKIEVHDYHWKAFNYIVKNPGCKLAEVARAAEYDRPQILIMELTYRFPVYQDERGKCYTLRNEEIKHAASEDDEKGKGNPKKASKINGTRQGSGGVLQNGSKRLPWSSREKEALEEEREKEAYFKALQQVGHLGEL